MDAYTEDDVDCETCMALIGRDAVASMTMCKAENAHLKLTVKKHEEEIARLRKKVVTCQMGNSLLELTAKDHGDEIARLRKRVQEQEEEIKRLNCEEEIARLRKRVQDHSRRKSFG